MTREFPQIKARDWTDCKYKEIICNSSLFVCIKNPFTRERICSQKAFAFCVQMGTLGSVPFRERICAFLGTLQVRIHLDAYQYRLCVNACERTQKDTIINGSFLIFNKRHFQCGYLIKYTLIRFKVFPTMSRARIKAFFMLIMYPLFKNLISFLLLINSFSWQHGETFTKYHDGAHSSPRKEQHFRPA